MGTVSATLEGLGITLPEAPQPVAAYVPARVQGTWCFTSGQLPLESGRLIAQGAVGSGVDLETAKKAARLAALNAIAVAAAAVGGVDRIRGVVKVTGYVQSADDFHGQPQVINGASELFLSIFGEAGAHARSAVGVNALPMDASVEVECIFEVAP